MTNKFKTAVAAAALLALPMTASAASVVLSESGVTLIELGNEYTYEETVTYNGAGSASFGLTSTDGIRLDSRMVTLEFAGVFQNLQVNLTDLNGVTAATQDAATAIGSFFSLSTVFNAANGLTQQLDITWDGINVGAGSDNVSAQFSIQAVPSEVPVPAAGLLLLTAVGGAAAARRRKKAA